MTPVQDTIKDVQKLKQFFLDKAKTCVHSADGLLKYPFLTPSYAVDPGGDDKASVPARSTIGHYLQMYDWDACFFSEGATLAGLPDLAPDVVANFMSLKHADGYVPRTVSPGRIWDAGDMCKPFLCQALAFKDKYKNHGASAQLLQDLDCYLNYYERHRQDKSGLFHWRNVLESGVDDNLALVTPQEAAKDENESIGTFPDGKMLAVDLSAYMVAEYRAFATLADHAGNPTLAAKSRTKADAILDKIESHMWDEQFGMYLNLYPNATDKLYLRSWTGLAPALLGLSKPERLEQVIHKNILNPEHFYRPAGLSSMAASEPLYNNAKRGLYGRAIVSNWQGPMWVLPNALAVRCLLSLGMKKEAVELASRVVRTMVNGLNERGTLFENYNADTGEPLWAPEFMSWNILAMELIQILE